MGMTKNCLGISFDVQWNLSFGLESYKYNEKISLSAMYQDANKK